MGRKGHIVMKKSLWGYNVQEVEDTLELMESQQAAQVQKNQHLESELKQLREKLAVLQQEKEAGRLFVGRAEDDPQVQARLEALTREKEEWKVRAESLSARLTQPENGGDMEQVSEICRLAYNDMSEAKKNVRRRLEEYVEDFLCEWRTGQEKVDRLMQDIDGVRDQAKESFIAAADEILTRFGELETDSLTMREKLENTEETETEMRGRFEQVLKALAESEAAGTSAEEPAVVEEPAEEESGESSLILRAITERRRPADHVAVVTPIRGAEETAQEAPKPPEDSQLAEGIIGVSVGVNPKQVFRK